MHRFKSVFRKQAPQPPQPQDARTYTAVDNGSPTNTLGSHTEASSLGAKAPSPTSASLKNSFTSTTATSAAQTKHNARLNPKHLQKRTAFRGWWFELLTLFGAFLLFGGMIWVLVQYDDMTLEEWDRRFIISLNTMVAIMSNILRAFFMLIAQEGWFAKNMRCYLTIC